MFFYALFPLLIAPAVRMSRRAGSWVAGLLALLILTPPLVLRPLTHGASVADWAIFTFPVQRLWEFGLGSLIALWIRKGGRLRHIGIGIGAGIGLVALAYAAATVALPVPDLGGTAVHPVRGDHRRSRPGRRRDVLVSVPPPRARSARRVVVRLLPHAPTGDPGGGPHLGASSTAVAVAASALSLVGSIASAFVVYTVVERPLERRLHGGTLPNSAGGVVHVASR
jgi:peptidoglycan/LPS O-acetylase OafA/YrhL